MSYLSTLFSVINVKCNIQQQIHSLLLIHSWIEVLLVQPVIQGRYAPPRIKLVDNSKSLNSLFSSAAFRPLTFGNVRFFLRFSITEFLMTWNIYDRIKKNKKIEKMSGKLKKWLWCVFEGEKLWQQMSTFVMCGALTYFLVLMILL